MLSSPLFAIARRITDRLAAAGFTAYFAGGCVRDHLLGRAAKDVDIATSARPEEVEALFERTHAIGKAFGVIQVVMDDEVFEVATFRRDLAYEDGRRPLGVEASTPEEDARRRDFTLNGLFLDPASGELIDFVGGRADLDAHIIRAIGDPAERFREDHLRLLRAVRFAAVLGFGVEEKTLAALRELAPCLSRISVERVRTEFTRLLTEAPRPGDALELLADTGLLAQILPEALSLKACEQPPEFHPEGDVWVHTVMMLNALRHPSPELALAVLLHDIGKPATRTVDPDGRIRFKGHAQVGADLAFRWMRRMKFSRAMTEAVTGMVDRHMNFMNVRHMRKATLRRVVGSPLFGDELELHRIDCLCSNGITESAEILRRVRAEYEAEEALPAAWVGGKDLIALGLPPGPEIGRWKERAYDAQLGGEVADKESLLAALRAEIGAARPASVFSDPFQLPRATLSEAVETRAEKILSQLSRGEKLDLCHANSIFTVAGVERLGLPEWEMSDGPHGVRMEMKRDEFVPRGDWDDASTYLPVGIALGATWSVECAAAFGDALGAEARARGKDVILGPGVNLIRTPLCGRNFEYLGEDPQHAGALALALTRAIQAHDVAACVKHFALNNQELNRHGVNVEVDERVLRELYLTAFELVVTRGGCLTVMGAYNRFRGQYCCHHAYLLQTILKGEWGFPYAVISDWGGAHDAEEAARNGLDVEMGGKLDALYLDRPFREGLERGDHPESLLDDKVRRVLRVQAATRLGDAQRSPGERLTPRHQDIARRIAEECLVLLKNGDGLLPLDAGSLRRVAVIGDNADRVHASGGGSSGIRAVYEVTPLEGLRAALGEGVVIEYVRAYPVEAAGIRPIPVERLGVADQAGIRGWRLEVYDNRNEKGAPSMTGVASVPDVDAGVCLLSGADMGNWMAKWTATVTPGLSGTYRLACTGGDYFELKVDGRVLSSVWDLTEAVCTTEAVDWEAGRSYQLALRYRPKMIAQGFRFGWITPDADLTSATDPFAEAEAAARRADVVLCFAGTSHFQDCEGADRRDMALLGGQNDLIGRLAAANPRLAVVLFGGSAVELPWLERVPALIQAWYPGQEGGHAIARVLLGAVNPSGRLPFSWPKRLQDVAAHAHDSYHADHAEYREGMKHGYRWHNGEGPDALFPFGHGLGYTTFAYRDLAIDARDPALFRVSLTLANTGDRPGAEVVQVYLAPGDEAPELKGFAKVELQAGGETRLDFTFGPESRRRWDESRQGWMPWCGPIRVHVGASATDIRLRG